MSLPIGHRRAFSYDDALDSPVPPRAAVGKLPWKPGATEQQGHQQQVEQGGPGASPTITVSPATDNPDHAPVKTTATAMHVIMDSLITRQTQENTQHFEQQAALRDMGYTPHRGLTAEETRYLRMAEALRKLKLQSGEGSGEKSDSAQSTPSSTPTSSPRPKSRGWFASGIIPALPGSNPSSSEGGSGEDKWTLFAPRPLQRSESAGAFATQPYQGGQKPSSPVDLTRGPATCPVQDATTLKPPRLDLPGTDAQKPRTRAHKIKPRDLNVFTPSGF